MRVLQAQCDISMYFIYILIESIVDYFVACTKYRISYVVSWLNLSVLVLAPCSLSATEHGMSRGECSPEW